MKGTKNAPQKTTHGGLTNSAPKAPSGHGVQGKANKDTPCRSKTAPTPRTIGGRYNG